MAKTKDEYLADFRKWGLLGGRPKAFKSPKDMAEKIAAFLEACETRIVDMFLFVLAVRDTQQMVDIGLDCHGLPHLLLRRSVVSVECLFPRRQLAAFFF